MIKNFKQEKKEGGRKGEKEESRKERRKKYHYIFSFISEPHKPVLFILIKC